MTLRNAIKLSTALLNLEISTLENKLKGSDISVFSRLNLRWKLYGLRKKLSKINANR